MFTDSELAAIADSPDAMDLLESLADSFYYTFKPRPDNPANYDEQEGYVNSDSTGVIFHIGGNAAGTSEATVFKLSQFVLHKQPPPRRATPFWIIGPSFEKITKSFWTEKILGHGHIPRDEIHWDGIVWDSVKAGKPREVPLKPWPKSHGGHPDKWWTLVFKSTDQDIQQFSAEAIGGFAFSEQFPWTYLEETLRGCREYNFPGSKMCEFTPLDPSLSVEIEEMIENDSLPAGWEIYRANTEANVKDPNSVVGEEWFGEFFGLISQEMEATRKVGDFASYKGRIYQSFNRKIHLVTGTEIPRGAFHFRGVDWGASEENAFVVLWAYRDSLGCWYVYDEYYSTRQDCTWLDHARDIHAKDGWDLVPDGSGGYRLETLNGEVRWRYGSDPHFGSTFAPPDRPDLFREFARYRMPCAAANCGPGSVLDGIETVRRLLKVNDKTREPNLYIDKERCPNLTRQIQTYRWLAGTTGTNPRDAKPVPLKRDDHAPDALRYLLHSASKPGGSETVRMWSEPQQRESVRMRKPIGSRSRLPGR